MPSNATDIVSNDVLIQALRAPDGVRGLLRSEPELPASVYPAFAHETTHHWCFVSPIGATVALLRVRSDVALWRAHTAQDVEAAASGRVLADALTTMFRPIAEGIALFAELNMRASITGLAVEPCEWVTQHLIQMPELLAEMQAALPDHAGNNFDQVPDDHFQRFVANVNSFLDDARLEVEQIEARRRISMRRLDSGDGAYLAGYLLIKRGYNRLLRSGTENVDANSFLAFAKEFFFHDTDLALAVLTGSAKVSSITARMAERLRLFDSESSVGLYRDFVPTAERTSRAPIAGRWKPTIATALGVRPDGDEAVTAAMTNIMEQERALPDKSDLDLAASTILQRVYGRHLFKLGTLTGSLSTKWQNGPSEKAPLRMALFEPDEAYNMSSLLFLPQISQTPFSKVPASIDLLFWSSANRMILATYVGTELVGANFNRENLVPEVAAACEALAAEHKALTTNIATIQKQVKVALDDVFRDFEYHVDQQNRAALDDMLAGRLFPNVPNPKGIFNHLRDRGLFKLYDTPDRPERFARICATVACDVTPSPDEINSALTWSHRCEAVTGWPMLEKLGERLLTAL